MLLVCDPRSHGRRQRRDRLATVHLAVAPCACLLGVLLPFLLVTASFEHVGVVQVGMADWVDPPGSVELLLDMNGATVRAENGHSTRIGKPFGELDEEALRAALRPLARDSIFLVVVPEDGVRLEEIIRVIDVSLGEALWIVSVEVPSPS